MAVEVDMDGARATFGPFAGLPDAMRFVSDHVHDVERYSHRYVTLADPNTAGWLNPQTGEPVPALFDPPPRERRQPLEAALRDRIADEHGDPGDSPHGDSLYAQLDLHRPWPVQLADEQCWEDECDHPADEHGRCSEPRRRELWCRGCTATYVAGGEHDGQPLPECRVDWPCSVVLTMSAALRVPLLGLRPPPPRLEE